MEIPMRIRISNSHRIAMESPTRGTRGTPKRKKASLTESQGSFYAVGQN